MNDDQDKFWPDHDHISRWPSDATGERDRGLRRRGRRRGPRIPWIFVIATCVAVVLFGADYLKHRNDPQSRTRKPEPKHYTKKDGEDVMDQVIGDPDKAIRDFKWPDISAPKQDDRKKGNKKGDVQ